VNLAVVVLCVVDFRHLDPSAVSQFEEEDDGERFDVVRVRRVPSAYLECGTSEPSCLIDVCEF
jgi:hypothetical protein